MNDCRHGSVHPGVLKEDSTCLLPSSDEMATLSDEELRALERAVFVVVGLRFESERRRRLGGVAEQGEVRP